MKVESIWCDSSSINIQILENKIRLRYMYVDASESAKAKKGLTGSLICRTFKPIRHWNGTKLLEGFRLMDIGIGYSRVAFATTHSFLFQAKVKSFPISIFIPWQLPAFERNLVPLVFSSETLIFQDKVSKLSET